jgi:SAM-dependent methyltransferase
MTSYVIKTEYPLALDSPDYYEPMGARLDNNTNPLFLDAVEKLLIDQQIPKPWTYLDLGCAGGQLVADFIQRGFDALGLEGSDYNKERGHFNWSEIPDKLFNCDIAKPFQIERNGLPAKFSIITAWEVLEHPTVEGVQILIPNIANHLEGFFIGTISWFGDDGASSVHHQVYHDGPKEFEWWDNLFVKAGMIRRDDIMKKYFPPKTWVRHEASWTVCYEKKLT